MHPYKYMDAMVIEYGNSKDVKCYRNFVLNPDDRSAARAFSKTFGVPLMSQAKKLHDRLIKYVSAGAYNAIFGQTDNRIEIKQGCRDKEPLVLKVRIGQGPRKFFNHIIDKEATKAKIRTLLTNIYEDRNSKFDSFRYRGKMLSQYCNPDWIEDVAKVVEGEIYNEAGPNNARAYTNVKAVYDNIKLDFYHRLNQ